VTLGGSTSNAVSMLASRVSSVNTPAASSEGAGGGGGSSSFANRLRAYLEQDQYVSDDDDASNDASFDNFYDAPSDAQGGLPDVRINMDPQDRLAEAIETLKGVIVENTNAQRTHRRKGRSSGSTGPQQYKADGTPVTKDEKLKIRKEKVVVELRVVFLKNRRNRYIKRAI
jgi:hypothetical protein